MQSLSKVSHCLLLLYNDSIAVLGAGFAHWRPVLQVPGVIRHLDSILIGNALGATERQWRELMDAVHLPCRQAVARAVRVRWKSVEQLFERRFADAAERHPCSQAL